MCKNLALICKNVALCIQWWNVTIILTLSLTRNPDSNPITNPNPKPNLHPVLQIRAIFTHKGLTNVSHNTLFTLSHPIVLEQLLDGCSKRLSLSIRPSVCLSCRVKTNGRDASRQLERGVWIPPISFRWQSAVIADGRILLQKHRSITDSTGFSL